jgi:hypothetical protein
VSWAGGRGIGHNQIPDGMSRMTLVDSPKPTDPDPRGASLPPPVSVSIHRLRARGGGPLLLVLSVALCLVGSEAAVRLSGLGARRASGYAPVNTSLAANRHENARGYRDEERSLAKPPGVRRVVSLGDSFAWGVGVKFDDSYPRRLERDLVLRRQEAWEVVNLALRGMNTVDEAAKLAGEGMAYDPDVVLVGYVLNDSEGEGSAEKRRADDWLERRRQGPAAAGLLGHSALFRLVRTRLEATAENRRRIAAYKSMYAEDDPGWVAGRKALRAMGALCRQKGIPLVVAIFPLFGNPLDDRYPFADLHAKVSQSVREAGAQVVDLLPVYRGLRWDLLVVDGFEDEHPNEIAHRIAAGVLVRAFDDVVAPAKAPTPPAPPRGKDAPAAASPKR